MSLTHENQKQLVIEKRWHDGTTALIARWSDTPRGWDILTQRAMKEKARDPLVIECLVRQTRASDDLTNVPNVVQMFVMH